MNLDDILKQASIYDLFRLQASITHELSNQKRLDKIKHSISIGQTIQYFNSKFNNVISAVVIEKYKDTLLVEHVDHNGRWEIRYYAININDNNLLHCERSNHNKLNKGNVAIGDLLGFKHHDKQIVGHVVKINPKTVKLITNEKHTWNVYYGHLYHITDTVNRPHMDVIDL